MTNSTKPYIVVVGVDYSTTGDLALDRALELCENQPLSTLHVVNVTHRTAGIGDLDQPKNSGLAEVEARLQDYVEKKTTALQSEGKKVPQRILCHVRWDAPGEEVAQLASDVEADLVVVGSHGRRGLQRLFMGSVAEAVVRLAPCPVLVERPKGLPNVPAIQPPCPECLKARDASSGATYWCAQHSERHGQRHSYSGDDRLGRSSTLPNVGW
ncbi:MAG TPA: universal stress protein [Polyangiaceae bacterium]|jgi:nucleotide-binding universal stress UspA family protein|nr:universal stress protein [Polyangiaceae bacterium]